MRVTCLAASSKPYKRGNWCYLGVMEKAKLKEHDGMQCRSCGNEERASEGYPCSDCGTFICLICTFRGVTRCKACEEKAKAAKA